MQQRKLGVSGPTSSAIAFGAMALTGIYGEVAERDARATLAAARHAGITHIDTAEVYGSGENERLVGRAIAGIRDEILLATKFNFRGYADAATRAWPEIIDASIAGSLSRLGVDYVDIWYLHRVPVDRPIEETWGPMSRAVERGDVRYLGLSEASAATIRRAHAVHPVTVLQSEWSLLTRDVEDQILPTIRELGIGFVAYSPLSRGLLGGRIRGTADLAARDWRRDVPRFRGDALAANSALVDRLAAFADGRGITLAQLALAWLLAQGEDVVPLVGARGPAHVTDSAGAAAVVLSTGDLTALDAIVPRGATSGDRYPADYMPGLVR
jgi:aryl-alcohol dehydrogenase-like predicted oxidoreductase